MSQGPITTRRYTATDKPAWDDFVSEAKNASFLFKRDYVDYHSDRFTDHSLLIYTNNELTALFIANEHNGHIVSHGGLTYGGMILRKDAMIEDVLKYFYHMVKYYHDRAIGEITYKCFPSYLTSFLAQEDLYALFLLKAPLVRRDTSCVLNRHAQLPYQHRRQRAIRKADKAGCTIERAANPDRFWQDVLIPNLEDRFGVKPVHSIDEMKLLMDRFPNNIHLYQVSSEKLLGGTLLFENRDSVHAQYISATPEGKDLGALDYLFDHLIKSVFSSKTWFSFGISNEEGGRVLNRGLITWKEGFGARAFAMDFYKIDTKQYTLLSEYE